MSVSKVYLIHNREHEAPAADKVLVTLNRDADREIQVGQWHIASFRAGMHKRVEASAERTLIAEPIVAALGRIEESLYAHLRLYGTVPVQLVINREAAAEYLPPVADGLAQAQRLDEVISLARTWAAAHTGVDVSAEALEELLSVPHTFAEDGFYRLLDLLGLPYDQIGPEQRFGGMVGYPYDASYVLPGGRKIQYADLRFILGKGDGFHGLWDKAEPASPIARFPPTGKGWRESRREWAARLNALPPGEWLMD